MTLLAVHWPSLWLGLTVGAIVGVFALAVVTSGRGDR